MKLLVFQHVMHEHPGLITKYADAKGVDLDIVELWKPYKIPAISGYDALVVMGGPMGVYDSADSYPSKKDEIKTIQLAVKDELPILGICLGSQLLAHALGANVYPNVIGDKVVKEIGYYTVDLTPEGANDKIFRDFSSPVKVLQWHGDAFDLPQNAKLLATSPLCRNQAFSYGNVYGFLFHCEFTAEMVARQIEIDRDWIHKDHDVDESELMEEARRNASLMEVQCERLFQNFISVVRS